MRIRWLNILICSLVASTAFAESAGLPIVEQQNDAQMMLERMELEKQFRGRQQTPEVLVVDADAIEQVREKTGPEFQLTEIRFPASRVLTKQSLDELASDYLGREIYLSDLQELTVRVTAKYHEAGFITARAYLPPQKIRNGVAEIGLVEAVVGAFSVVEGRGISEDYLRARLDVTEGNLLNPVELESHLIRFNRLNRHRLNVDLKGGARFGTTDILVNTLEQKTGFTAYAENKGAETTGDWRGGLVGQINGLFNRSDPLSFSLTTSEGANTAFVSYSAPVMDSDTRIETSVSYSDSDIVEGSFAAQNVEGDSRKASLSIIHPLKADRRWLVLADAGLHYSDSETLFGGFEVANKVKKLMLGATLEYAGDRGIWNVRPQLHRMKVSSVTLLGEDERYVEKFSVSTFGLYMVNSSLRAVVRGSMQFGFHDVLPPSEQMRIGGAYGVRGYQEDRFSGDDGYMVNVDLYYRVPERWPVTSALDAMGWDNVQLYGFIDHGGSFANGNEDRFQRDDFANSLGLGIRASGFGDRVDTDLYLAYGMDKVHSDGDTLDVYEIGFSLRVSF